MHTAVFPKKFRFPRFWAKRSQNGPKIDLFGFFSKSALRIFLILCIWLEGIIALILPKTACLAKFRFRSYGPKRQENRERKELMKIWFDFRIPQSFLYKKCCYQIFRILTPSPSKLRPNIGTEKSPNSGFSIFSSLGCQIFFILHSQVKDHESSLL